MPRPRRIQISLEDTPYYHCCSRVVRRAFLCGDDAYSGKNYDHRRGWVESLLFELEAVFAIDVAAFAIMSNHLHLVLHIDIETANRWTDREVLCSAQIPYRCLNADRKKIKLLFYSGWLEFLGNHYVYASEEFELCPVK